MSDPPPPAAPAAAENSTDRAARRPLVSYTFLALCLLITLPSLAFPALYDVFGGIAPRRYPWQLFTAVFEHGWPGFPGIVHLGLNAVLIVLVGPPCERLLGSGRFLALCLASATANALAQLATGGVNGSSLVIWSWGPPLAAALWQRRRRPAILEPLGASAEQLRGLLLLMYGVITLLMAALPYAAGYRGDPLTAFAMGNLYHLVATGVGIAAIALWWRRICARTGRALS